MSGIKSFFSRVPLQAFLFSIFSIYIFYQLGLPVENVYDIEVQKVLENPNQAMINMVTDAHAFLSYGKHGVVALNIQDKQNVSEVGEYDTFGTARGLALRENDNVLFVADGANGIVILDVSNPADLTQIGHVPGIQDARDVVLKDDYAYIVDGAQGLYTLRINPLPIEGEEPQLQNNNAAGVGLTRILVRGNNIYTIGVDNNLHFFKILGNSPSATIKTPTIPVGAPIKDFAVWEYHLFFAADGLGLGWIENPSDGTTEISGSYAISGVINTLDVYGDFAFLGIAGSGIAAYDISNLPNVQPVSGSGDINDDDIKDPSRLIYDVSYIEGEIDHYVFVGDGRKGFKTVQVIYQAKGRDADQGKVLGSVEDIAVYEDYVYAASCEQGIWVIETRDAEDGIKKNTLGFHEIKELRGCHTAVAVDETRLYLINAKEGGGTSISIYDRSVSYVTPQFISDIDTPGTANDLVVSGEYIFVADGNQGLQILQSGGVFNAVVAGLPFDDGDGRAADAQGIFLRGNYAYLAVGNEGLQVVNIEDPFNPQPVSSHELGFYARAVFVYEHPYENRAGRVYAYIVGGRDGRLSGMKVVDITNPARPQDVGNLIGVSEPLLDVVVQGPVAYVLQKSQGVMQFNITNPEAPLMIEGGESIVANYSRLTLHDQIIYIGKREQGFQAIRRLDSGEIVVVLQGSGRWVVKDAVEVEKYIYIVDGDRGLRIVDISDYENPTMVKFFPTSGPSQGITIDWNRNRAYLANSNQGLEILDISNRENPFQIGVYAELNGAVDVEFTEAYAYVATSDGLAVLDIRDLGEIKLVALHELEGSIEDVTIRGDFLFISKGYSGMVVLSIVNPMNPSEIYVEKTNLSNALKAISSPHPDQLIVADGENGLNVFDVSNPAVLEPIYDYEHEDGNNTSDVSVRKRYIVAADGDNGARIFYFPGEYFVPSWRDTVEIGSVGERVTNAIITDLTSGEPADFHVVISEVEGGLRVRRIEKGLQTTKDAFVEAPGKANILELILGGSNPKRTQRERLLFLGGIGGYMLASWALLALISRMILPIETGGFPQEVFSLLSAYLGGRHGPVVFVEDGKDTPRQGPFRKIGPGYIKIDTCSAVVLEKTAFQPSLLGGLIRSIRGRHPRQNLGMRTVDVGINFTGKGERVRGVANLRRQIRLRPGVKAHTRDGIEVNCVVLALFTLSEPPEVYQVTYEGEEKPENLRLVRTRRQDPEEGQENYQIQVVSQLEDILDDEDKLEVHRYVQAYRRRAGVGSEEISVEPESWRPYRFYPQRVFSAITSRPFDVLLEKRADWEEIPAHIAVQTFRELLSQEQYDGLFLPGEPKPYPLTNFKNLMRTRMVNKGILAFQFLERADGEPIQIDQELRNSEIVRYPVREFKTRKVLRSRGIKIITAGFTELQPSIADVQQRYLFDHWRAPWQQEAIIIQSDHELQATRMKNHARAQAQRDMAYTLSKILSTSQFSKEAMALRVFQALENAATDPTTQRLLPRDAIDILRSLRNLLLPGEAPRFLRE